MKRSNNPQKFFSLKETQFFQSTIASAEQKTSAEIKLVVVRHCWDDIRRKAIHLFKKYKLYETKERNAVLIMLVTTSREFVIYGDEGIHQKVGYDFWLDVIKTMKEKFKEDKFGEGISLGISSVGEKLSEHFPRQKNDQNEISDEIGYEN